MLVGRFSGTVFYAMEDCTCRRRTKSKFCWWNEAEVCFGILSTVLTTLEYSSLGSPLVMKEWHGVFLKVTLLIKKQTNKEKVECTVFRIWLQLSSIMFSFPMFAFSSWCHVPENRIYLFFYCFWKSVDFSSCGCFSFLLQDGTEI